MFALSIQTVFLAHNFFTIDGNSSSESCSGKSILKDLNKAVEAHFNVHSMKLKKETSVGNILQLYMLGMGCRITGRLVACYALYVAEKVGKMLHF